MSRNRNGNAFLVSIINTQILSVLARSRAYGPVLSVCPSVRKHDNSLQTQPIDLKLSTHLNKSKLGAKFEDGQNRKKNFHVMDTSSKPILGLWDKKNFCLIDLKFGTLAFWVIKNDF